MQVQELLRIQDFISIREVEQSDLNFILSSSIQCLARYSHTLFKGWEHDALCKHLESMVLCGMGLKHYSTFIACHNENSEEIVAYIVADIENNHIFLQYTKYAYRKLGIQGYLMNLITQDKQNVTVNFATKEMLKLQKINKVKIVDKFTQTLMKEVSHAD